MSDEVKKYAGTPEYRSYVAAVRKEMTDTASQEPLKHTLSCGVWPGSEADCTCGLVYRQHLQTEQTMHAAWRKRAEESEHERDRLAADLAAVKAEVIAMMNLVPKECRIQSCEGGGPENPIGSVCLSIGRMAADLKAVKAERAEAVRLLKEANFGRCYRDRDQYASVHCVEDFCKVCLLEQAHKSFLTRMGGTLMDAAKRILELDAKATPGEWVYAKGPLGSPVIMMKGGWVIANLLMWPALDDDCPEMATKNGPLICEYRTLAPAVAWELIAARERIERLEAALVAIRDCDGNEHFYRGTARRALADPQPQVTT